ncbi:MAG: MarC family protein [Thermodesulfovibrionales bacterium]
MENVLKALPHTFIPIFVAIDVFAILPIFISLTADIPESRKQIIRDSIFTALIVGLSFVALGEAIFSILGITSDDFKIAGGLVLLILSISELIRHEDGSRKPTGRVGVVPIGVPLIVGPAVLTTVLVLVDHFGIISTVISLILNLFIVWMSFVNAERITNFLGKGTIGGISKIMALLLASIAVMMIRLGISNFVKGV